VSADSAQGDERPPDGPAGAGLPVLAAALVVGVAATGAGLLLPGADLTDGQEGAIRAGGLVAAVLALLALTTRAGGPARTPVRDLPALLFAAAALLAGVALVSAPFSPISYDPPDPAVTTTTEPSTTTTTRPATTTTTIPDRDADPERDLVPLIQTVVLAAVLALAAYAMVRLVGWRRIASWWRAARPAAPDIRPGTPIDVAAAEAGLEASLDAATSGLAPRDAISDAYARLLAALDEAGAGRRPAEAPHEHLDRVLGPLGVRSAPLHELAELFVFARFSQHPVTDAHRARAVAALGEALADLRTHRASGATSAVPEGT
jgi:Domain of unknown function (DUF4129)